MTTIKRPIKKAQTGIVTDKTAVKKTDAKKMMRGDNEAKVRVLKNEADRHAYNRRLDVGSIMQGNQDDKTVSRMLNAARRDDSLSTDALKKARQAKANPTFSTEKTPKLKVKLKTGGSVKAKDGKWMQKAAASIKKRGTAGKCTPITKPGCTGKAKALAKTFRKISKKK